MTTVSRRRAIGSRALVVLATILLIVSIIVTWVRVQLLDTGGWTRTATATLQDAQVRRALAGTVSDRLLQVVDFNRIASARLPSRAAVAGPLLSAAAAETVPPAVTWALGRPQVQQAWSSANRIAHRQLLALLNGGSGALRTDHGVVSIDLQTLLNTVGSTLRLGSVGSKLPPNRRLLVLLHSRSLATGQRIVRALKALAWVLPAVVALLFLCALTLAHDLERRQTLLQAGAGIAIAALLSLLLRRWIESYVVDGLVSQSDVRPAIRAVMAIATASWRDEALWLLTTGVLVVLGAVLAGPAAAAVRCRQALTGPLERHPGWVVTGIAAVAIVVAAVGPVTTPIRAVPLVILFAGSVLGVLALRRQVLAEDRAGCVRDRG